MECNRKKTKCIVNKYSHFDVDVDAAVTVACPQEKKRGQE